jgi:hypothetical protein
MVRSDSSDAEFSRLHRLFQFHFGIATTLAWITSAVAAFHAPWVRDIYHFIDPMGPWKPESTGSYLFGFPLLMSVAWLACLLARDILFDMRLRGHLKTEFAVAGSVAFLMFYLSIERAVTAMLAASA